MTEPGRPGPRLEVEADLQLEVTDASGTSSGVRVDGRGGGLRVEVDRPDVALGALPGGLGSRREASAVLTAARSLGSRIEIHGPRGRLAVIDPDEPGGVARRLGAPGVQVSPALAGAWARGPGRAVLVRAGVAVALGAVVALAIRAGR